MVAAQPPDIAIEMAGEERELTGKSGTTVQR